MSETKHTPGPWEVHNGTDIFTQRGTQNASGMTAETNDGWHICGMGGITMCEGQFEQIPYGEQRANARLIAAAPEMYALLKRIKNEYFDYSLMLSHRHQITLEVNKLLEKLE